MDKDIKNKKDPKGGRKTYATMKDLVEAMETFASELFKYEIVPFDDITRLWKGWIINGENESGELKSKRFDIQLFSANHTYGHGDAYELKSEFIDKAGAAGLNVIRVERDYHMWELMAQIKRNANGRELEKVEKRVCKAD